MFKNNLTDRIIYGYTEHTQQWLTKHKHVLMISNFLVKLFLLNCILLYQLSLLL